MGPRSRSFISPELLKVMRQRKKFDPLKQKINFKILRKLKPRVYETAFIQIKLFKYDFLTLTEAGGVFYDKKVKA